MLWASSIGGRWEKRYLDMAEKIRDEFALKDAKGAPLAGDYLKSALDGKEFFQMPKPRWESLHPIMGLAELYWGTGNEDYRRAFERIWWSIVKLDRHNNGGVLLRRAGARQSVSSRGDRNVLHGGLDRHQCRDAAPDRALDRGR